MSSKKLNLKLLPASIAVLLFVAGCSVTPEKIPPSEVSQRIQGDREAIYRAQEPLREPVTFSVALARALKYNLDYKLKLMESALSLRLLEVSELDMLPKVIAEAGYSSRNNDSGGTSIGIEDRVVSLRPSTSEERQHYTARATFSWNALDFGLSYYRAKQASDEYNIAEERRRKILHNIVQDVRNAYWRAVSAQQLLGEANSLYMRINDAMQKSREAERAGVLPPTQALAYQRALLDAMTLINVKRQEMEFAKRELAALMSVTPGTDFTLADRMDDRLAQVPVNIGELEQIALENRPELREEDYKKRIGVVEAKKQIAALFPSLNFTAGPRYDSNDYAYNNSWFDAGVSLSVNLMRLASYPTFQRTNDARAQNDQARRLALTMAIITQVRVSVERYKLSVLDYRLAADSTDVDQRLASIARGTSSNKLESELESLRTEARALVSRFQLATAYAATQASYGRIMNSVGLDLLPDTIASLDIPTLSRAIDESLDAGERNAFVTQVQQVDVMLPVLVRVSNLPAGVNADAVKKSIENIVTRNSINVVNSTAPVNGVTPLVLSMEYQPVASTSTTRARWNITLSDSSGKQVVSQNYGSFVPNASTDRTMGAFAEAATLSVIGSVRQASRDQNTN